MYTAKPPNLILHQIFHLSDKEVHISGVYAHKSKVHTQYCTQYWKRKPNVHNDKHGYHIYSNTEYDPIYESHYLLVCQTKLFL